MTRSAATASKATGRRKKSANKSPATRRVTRLVTGKIMGSRQKPTTSALRFAVELARTLAETPAIRAIYKGRLDEGFREELMVAVAHQNRAPYCSWAHSTWATLAGIPQDQLEKVERMQLGELDPRLATAVAYVRAFASSDWKEVPRELRLAMQEHFTWREIEDIELVAKAMDLSNRGANTWEAMLSRLNGKAVADSDFLSELILSYLFLLILPIALVIGSRSTNRSLKETAQSLLNRIRYFEEQEVAG